LKKAEFTEYGKLFTGIMLVILLLIQVSFFTQSGSNPLSLVPYIILTALFLFLIVAFYKLTIKIESDRINFVYGIGFIKITKKIETITAIQKLKTPWYWGLGIRITPNGWLYNIQSRETLDISYTINGKAERILIGSNQRDELRKAVSFIQDE